MKLIVNSIDGYHADHVSDAVDDIQEKGWVVIKIKRLQKMFLGWFGEDVTEITYK